MAANRPSAAELTEAVNEFLSDELIDTVQRADLKFKLRIAINILGMVQRELQLGDNNVTREKTVLQALLKTDESSLDALNNELSSRIQRGEFDNGFAELCAALEQTVVDKLSVDNPRYSTFKALTAAPQSD